MRLRSLGVLLTLVVALVFMSGCFSEEPIFISATCDYTLKIKTATPIENVTFLVPVPMRGDLPAIGSLPVTAEFYADRLPDHYTCSIVPVDGWYYLRLTAPFIDPKASIRVNYYNSTSLGQKFRPEIVSQMIDTLHPFGNESLFSPKQNLALTTGSPEAVQTGGYNPSGYSYSYTIPVYAYYENGTQVEISSNIEGENEWGEGFDNRLSNRYSDSYYLTITGPPQGWTTAGGKVTMGQGNYREWQLAPTSTSGATT